MKSALAGLACIALLACKGKPAPVKISEPETPSDPRFQERILAEIPPDHGISALSGATDFEGIWRGSLDPEPIWTWRTAFSPDGRRFAYDAKIAGKSTLVEETRLWCAQATHASLESHEGGAMKTALLLASAVAQDDDLTNAQKLELYRKIRSCTVQVRAMFDVNKGAVGTGVGLQRLGDHVIVVTNAHVVGEGKKFTSQDVQLRPWTKGKEVWLKADIIALLEIREDFLDIAFLAVHDPGRLISIAPPVESRSNGRGKRIYACGHPKGEEFLVDDGEIIDVQEADWLIGHNALIEHGNSGGGLFDSRGRLIGINTWMVDGKYGLAQDIHAFLGWWKFHHARARADTDDWQDSGVEVKEAQFAHVLAVGTWTPDPKREPFNAIGRDYRAEKRVVQKDDFYYGSLLLQTGNAVVQIRDHYKKSTAQKDLWPDYGVRTVDALGKIKFRINDKDTSDNSGSLDVFIMVVGYPKGYHGVEARILTQEERKNANHEYGARVVKVDPYSPAALAGIQPGDILFLIQYQRVTGDNLDAVYLKCWDATMKLGVSLLRDGKEKNLEIDQHPRQWKFK